MSRRSAPRKLTDEAALYDYAVKALGRRMRAVAELKRLLRQRAGGDEPEKLIDAVITRLKDQKYLNDSAYAAAYTQYRRDNQKFGRMRIISDLKARGVHGDVINTAISAGFEGTDEETAARAYLARKRIQKPADDRAAARVFRTLLRAGYSKRVALRVLNKWNVDEEVLTALETEEE